MRKSIEQILTKNNIHNQLSIEQLLLTSWRKQFNEEQLNEINCGIESEVDVSIYAKPEFDWEQMAQIRWGLEDDLDVSLYAKIYYSAEQMQEIRWDLETEAEVKQLLD